MKVRTGRDGSRVEYAMTGWGVEDDVVGDSANGPVGLLGFAPGGHGEAVPPGVVALLAALGDPGLDEVTAGQLDVGQRL